MSTLIFGEFGGFAFGELTGVEAGFVLDFFVFDREM